MDRSAETTHRANELYWDSDESVNQITDELELSKSTLYALIEPRPAGLPCPRCTTGMEWANRTARDKGYLTCPACELEEDEEVVREAWRGKVEEGRPPARRPGAALAADDDRTRVIAATALLGAAVGLAVVLWMRKK